MAKFIVRGAFNYDADAVSEETGLKCLDESKTVQSDFAESDINLIVERVLRTGVMPMTQAPPLNIDFSEQVFDFQSAQDMIIEANKSFAALPAKVRARFGNDPAKFVDFFSDPENIGEAVKLGLAVAVPPVVDPASGDAGGVGGKS